MSGFTIVNWSDVDNGAAGWGIPEKDMEMRIGRTALGCTTHGVSFAKFGAGFTPTFGHTQKEQEEVYVVISGTALFNIDGTIHEVAAGSAVRIGPGVWRAIRAKGDEDVKMIITGAPLVDDDGVIDMEWWPA
jgi:mannose-6-phosphate isomerase-like protein (cupin superfamily)